MDRKRVTLNQNDLTDLDEPHKKPTMKSNIISKWFKRSWRDYVRVRFTYSIVLVVYNIYYSV